MTTILIVMLEKQNLIETANNDDSTPWY